MLLLARFYWIASYPYRTRLVSNRGDMSLKGMFGLLILVVAYLSFPDTFKDFFQFVQSYLHDNVYDEKERVRQQQDSFKEAQEAGKAAREAEAAK